MEADLIPHRKTIMVISDEAESRALIADLLELNGYTVTQAASSTEALAQLKLGSPAPALILLDLVTPKTDARAFIRRSRSRSWLARVPIVVMTDEDKSDLAGAADSLKKPVAGNTLLKCVGRHTTGPETGSFYRAKL
jgi:CheY-like chemotaxis protein